MSEQNERLARIETKMDNIIDVLNGDDGLVVRVRELETLKNKAWGFIIAIGAAGAAIGSTFTKALANIFDG